MLLSRFWYIVLAAVAGISVAAFSLVRSTYERDRHADSDTLLSGDRRQIDEFMRTEARVRLDNLSPVAGSADLARLLNTATSRTGTTVPPDLSGHVGEKLRALNNGMGPDAQGQMLIAVDAHGYVVGRVGVNENSGLGDFIGGEPLVARALEGYVRDDTWEIQGRVFRMAARPVIYQGRYVGAVLHAREIDDAFVSHLSEALGSSAHGDTLGTPRPTVIFYASSGVYASHPGEADLRGRPAPTVAQLSDLIHTLGHDANWNRRGYTDVEGIPGVEGSAVYGRVAGAVGINGGGFAVARPRPALPANYMLHAPSDEIKRVPWLAVIGLIVGGGLLGLLFVYLEHDRGARQLRDALHQLAERKIERLDPLALRGNARRTALAINDAFERAMKEELARAGAKPRRSVEDLDALLGAPPPTSPSSPFMDIPPPPPPVSSSGLIAPAQMPPLGRPPTPSISGSVPMAPPPPPMRPHTPPPPAPMVSPPRPPPPVRNEYEDDEPTSVASAGRLQGVLPRPAAAAAAGPLVAGASDAEEAAHWREVFDQFVATKKQCGEPTDTLVFEKFAATLVKHKEQLTQRTKCRAVRFQVYVKDGKATLKATPVK